MERLVILAAMEQYCKKVLPEMQPQEWEAFQSGLTIHSYAKGEHILREGEICRQVFYLFKGLIRFYYVQDGKEIITGFIDDNQFAADYTSFLQQTPSKKNIEALQPTWLAALPYTHMQHVYQQYPVFQIFGRRMAEQLYLKFDHNVTQLATLSPEERYHWLIQKQSPLLQTIPQYMLASFLGITPEHLSRIRRKSMK